MPIFRNAHKVRIAVRTRWNNSQRSFNLFPGEDEEVHTSGADIEWYWTLFDQDPPEPQRWCSAPDATVIVIKDDAASKNCQAIP